MEELLVPIVALGGFFLGFFESTKKFNYSYINGSNPQMVLRKEVWVRGNMGSRV
jgi:hypothetical protein